MLHSLRMRIKPRSHQARRRASTRPIKLMLKIGSFTPTAYVRRTSTNLHTSNERCQFKLLGYWTIVDALGVNGI